MQNEPGLSSIPAARDCQRPRELQRLHGRRLVIWGYTVSTRCITLQSSKLALSYCQGLPNFQLGKLYFGSYLSEGQVVLQNKDCVCVKISLRLFKRFLSCCNQKTLTAFQQNKYVKINSGDMITRKQKMQKSENCSLQVVAFCPEKCSLKIWAIRLCFRRVKFSK